MVRITTAIKGRLSQSTLGSGIQSRRSEYGPRRKAKTDKNFDGRSTPKVRGLKVEDPQINRLAASPVTVRAAAVAAILQRNARGCVTRKGKSVHG